MSDNYKYPITRGKQIGERRKEALENFKEDYLSKIILKGKDIEEEEVE